MAHDTSPPAPDDDPSILNDVVVWRRLQWDQMPEDSTHPGRRRMSSGAFDDSRDGTGMSVHVPLPGETVEHYLGEVQREHDGVAALVVGKIREGGYGIRFAPDAI